MTGPGEVIAAAIEAEADRHPGPETVGYAEVSHFRKGLRAAARVARAASAWIPVEDRLPAPRTWVVGLTPYGSAVVAACNTDAGAFWSDQQGYTLHLTHWMPLPPPPPGPTP